MKILYCLVKKTLRAVITTAFNAIVPYQPNVNQRIIKILRYFSEIKLLH